jgi:hypothetical protein
MLELQQAAKLRCLGNYYSFFFLQLLWIKSFNLFKFKTISEVRNPLDTTVGLLGQERSAHCKASNYAEQYNMNIYPSLQ